MHKNKTENKAITWLGLILAIGGYPLILLTMKLPCLQHNLPEQILTIVGLGLVWVLVMLLLAIVRRGEKRSLASIGIQKIKGKEIVLAIVLGIVLSLAVPMLIWLIGQAWSPNTAEGGLADVAAQASQGVLLLSVLTAGICEEIVFRGYLIERVREWTGQIWLAVLVSIVAFVLPHTVSWNLSHVVAVVLPLGLILSGLYLWQRNLYFNMVVHVVINLPLVFMA